MTRFEKEIGISSKKFNKLYGEYNKRYKLYDSEGFMRSDKLTKNQFKELMKANYQNDKESFRPTTLMKSKIKEQTTFIIGQEKNEKGQIVDITMSGKTARRWYESYVRQYNEQKSKLEAKGEHMYAEGGLLDFNQYMAVRNDYKKQGITQNVNRQIVAEQSYEYTMSNAKKIKDIASEYGLEDIAEANIRDIMKGDVDLSSAADNGTMLSAINDALKQAHPDWNGYFRKDFISHSVFGS